MRICQQEWGCCFQVTIWSFDRERQRRTCQFIGDCFTPAASSACNTNCCNDLTLPVEWCKQSRLNTGQEEQAETSNMRGATTWIQRLEAGVEIESESRQRLTIRRQKSYQVHYHNIRHEPSKAVIEVHNREVSECRSLYRAAAQVTGMERIKSKLF